MRLGLVTAGAACAVILSVGAASAVPIAPAVAPIELAVSSGADANLVLVRGGCGFGEHRGYYGHCRYNRGWRGRLRARRNYYWRHYY